MASKSLLNGFMADWTSLERWFPKKAEAPNEASAFCESNFEIAYPTQAPSRLPASP